MSDQPELTETEAAELGRKLSTAEPDVASAGPSAGSGQPEATVPKRPPGAPRGNKNNLRHGLRSEKTARELRDGPARRSERRVREILRSRRGLEGDALAEGAGDLLRMLWAGAYRLEALHDRRGMTHRDGRPKESFTSMLSVIDKLGSNLARLIDRVAELQGQTENKGDRFAGPLQITLTAVPAIGVGLECAMCGQSVGAARATPAPAQEPLGAVLPAEPSDDTSADEKPVRRPVAPCTLSEVYQTEPEPEVVESRRVGRFNFQGNEIKPAVGPFAVDW